MSHSKPMTAAPTPRDGERDLAVLLDEVARDPSLLQMEEVGAIGRCRWSVSETGKRLLDLCHNLEAHVAQRVAEAVAGHKMLHQEALEEADKLEAERDSLAALVVRLNGLLKESYDEIINLMVKVDAKEPQGWEGTRRRTLLRLHIEQALKAVPGDLADSVILRKSDDLYAVNKTLNARNEEVEGLIDEADLRNAALEAENRALRALVEEACEVIEEAGDGWTAESYIATAKDIRTKATLAPKEGK